MGIIELNTKTEYRSDFELFTTDGHLVTVPSGALNEPVFGELSLHDLVTKGIGAGAIPTNQACGLTINLSDTPVFHHPELTVTPQIRQVKVQVTITREAPREIPLEYYLYKQIFPAEEVIGACVLADDIRANNVRGNLAMIMIPRPDDVSVMFSFQTSEEAKVATP
jgi:hypothetical protein